MTVSEFREEFKLLYDNISSNAAPGLDDYEVSVYLTTAQLELVKKAYAGSSAKKGFEGNEKRRKELSSLVLPATFTPSAFSFGLKPYSLKVELPPLLYIVYERAKLVSTDTCISGTIAEVVPVTHDEFALIEENPFRKDSKRRVMRLDLKYSSENIVELICPEPIEEYTIRYVSIPEPIILSDLTVISAGLTIDGQTEAQTCLLNEGMHREILNRAVDLAIRDYRENSLQNKIQTKIGIDYKED